jgi:hydrogenase small subunit
MQIGRRSFLRYCGLSAAYLGIGSRMGALAQALEKGGSGAPRVVWLKGSSCDGCSISLLNRIADTAPRTAVDVLVDDVDLVFHSNLSTLCGESAVAGMLQTYERGNYILVVEGGVPTAFDGHACIAWSERGREVTFREAVTMFASRATHVICAGTCASWGGIPASGSNPTRVVGVQSLIGRTTVNIAGCPANPDWLVWPIVQVLTGGSIVLDAAGRPVALYQGQGTIHAKCPRRDTEEADTLGQDGRCMKEIGCRGPMTSARCAGCWNGKAGSGRWCIGVNAPCHGCVEPGFPGPQSFYAGELDD